MRVKIKISSREFASGRRAREFAATRARARVVARATKRSARSVFFARYKVAYSDM